MFSHLQSSRVFLLLPACHALERTRAFTAEGREGGASCTRSTVIFSKQSDSAGSVAIIKTPPQSLADLYCISPSESLLCLLPRPHLGSRPPRFQMHPVQVVNPQKVPQVDQDHMQHGPSCRFARVSPGTSHDSVHSSRSSRRTASDNASPERRRH